MYCCLTGYAIEQANLWYKKYKEQFRFSLDTDVVLSSQDMRARGQLCAVTSITKYEIGFRDQVPRLATYVVGNVRKGLNCEREVQKDETHRHESLLTRVVSSSQETRPRSNSVELTLKFCG